MATDSKVDPICLTLLDNQGNRTAQTWAFQDVPSVLIGRSLNTDVRISDPAVSRTHAKIFVKNASWWVANLGRHGTFLNGKPIQEAQLTDDCELMIADNGPRLLIEIKPLEELESSKPGSVSICLMKLAKQDDSAASFLWDRYFERLVILARRQFGSTSRPVHDEEDVAVTVLTKLFKGLQEGRFPDVEDRDGLWRILAIMTLSRTKDGIRHERRAKRGGGKTVRETDFGVNLHPMTLDALTSEVPPADQLAEFTENIRNLFNVLREDNLKQVAERKLQGYSHEEIAAELGVSVRTIERWVQKIRQIWSEEEGIDEE